VKIRCEEEEREERMRRGGEVWGREGGVVLHLGERAE
jgi:hypothetical protein